MPLARMGLGIGLGMDRGLFDPAMIPGFLYWLDSTVAGSFTLAPAAELLTDGDMEAVGTAAYTAGAATLSKLPGGVSGQLLRITATAGAGTTYPQAYQRPAVIGKTYTSSVRVRSDGVRIPQLWVGGAPVQAGTASTDWQTLSGTRTATSDVMAVLFQATGPAGTEYIEIDDWSVKLTDATNVSAWADKYGSRSVVQATENRRPSLNATGGPDGGPCVSFDGVNEFLSGAWADETHPNTRVLVHVPDAGSAAGLKVTIAANPTAAGVQNVYHSGTSLSWYYRTGGLGGMNPTIASNSAWQAWTLVANAANSSFRVNDDAPTLGDIVGTTNPSGMIIGAGQTTGAYPTKSSFTDIIGIKGVPSAGDLARLYAYLKALRGL